MKKFALAVICTFGAIGFVLADEFNAQITKVDGSKVTLKKGGAGGFGGGGGKKGGKATEEQKDETLTATSDVKVSKGEVVFDKAGGGAGGKKGGGKGTGAKGGGITYKSGDPVEGGLKNEMFTKAGETPVNSRVITNDKGEITEILVLAAKGGGGGKKGGKGTGK